MIDQLLAVIAILMLPFAILCTIVLGYAVKTGPRIGALTERSFIAIDTCIMLASGAVLTLNRLAGHAFFPIEVATTIFSASLIVLGLIPIYWVVLWYQGRLG